MSAMTTCSLMAAVLLCTAFTLAADADDWLVDLKPLVRSVDLNVGRTAMVEMSNGETATVELLAIDVDRDSLRDAVRAARVRVKVNGPRATRGPSRPTPDCGCGRPARRGCGRGRSSTR